MRKVRTEKIRNARTKRTCACAAVLSASGASPLLVVRVVSPAESELVKDELTPQAYRNTEGEGGKVSSPKQPPENDDDDDDDGPPAR